MSRVHLCGDSRRSLLELMRDKGISPFAPCGGQGKCGKCRVRLFSDDGAREVLACRTIPDGPCDVEPLHLQEQAGRIADRSSAEDFSAVSRDGLGVAADIGTTTVAMRLYDLKSGLCLARASGWNEQRSYGADVISRAGASQKDPRACFEQFRLINGQMRRMAESMCRESGRSAADIVEAVFAGNTVMQHLAAGLDPLSLSLAPYRPVTLFGDNAPLELPQWPGVAAFFAPCAAAYVGGDVVAGILTMNLHRREGWHLFLDIGTNGEIVLAGPDTLLCCAAACGPAFEGAEISCGMPSVPGAVSKVEWKSGRLLYSVVGGVPPRGFCGSGLTDLLAVLLRQGVIDETGRLLPPEEVDDLPESLSSMLEEDDDGNGRFFLTPDGTVFLAAADVRRLQLAKGAVAAGTALLLKKACLGAGQIRSLSVAGGFGSSLNPESASAIGLIPRGTDAVTRFVGNTSLAGACAMLLDPSKRDEARRIQRACRYMELSGSSDFSEAFMEQMGFPQNEDRA